DADQAAEQPPLVIGREPIQHVCVLAPHQVGQQPHLLADRRQAIERRHRRLELVAEAADVHRELRRCLGGKPPAHRADHRPACPTRVTPAARTSAARRRVCAWQTATASASAASADNRSPMPSNALTMCATWNFSAAPEPTSASLIARGAYSNTGIPPGTAHSAAPRA